ncbi:MAG: tautomerase family protein [Deltaproteobacteria bacterium]|nr:tautomerase family protein [Deltaproteobacteria bacterium]
MPNITIDGPPVKDLDKKREFVKELTNAATKFYGTPPQAIVVIIKENPAENVGVGGELVVDKP